MSAGRAFPGRFPTLEHPRAAFRRDRRTYLATLRNAATRGHFGALKRFLQAGFIAAHLARHPVDGLHAHFASSATRVANYASRLTGIPHSFTAHAKDIFHQDVNAATLRGKIRDARFVVTVSDFNRAYLQDLAAEGGAAPAAPRTTPRPSC